MFIVLEGIDGCGKSTQATRLVSHLKSLGREVVHVREPGGTTLGETIRSLLLAPESEGKIDARAEALLYSAARAELVHELLKPALAAGKTIVCERYLYSTLAYQGFGLDQDTAELQALSAYATSRLKPDLVLLLDLDPNAALARVKRDKDRIESRGASYLERVREGYLRLSRREPERFVVIDASRKSEEVTADLARAVEEHATP